MSADNVTEMPIYEELRELAYVRAGGGTGEATYDPELLDLLTRAADALESATAPKTEPTPAGASFWPSSDDAALGRQVRRWVAAMTAASDKLDRHALFVASLFICCEVAGQGAVRARFALDDITDGDAELGSWEVVVQRQNAGSGAEDEGRL